MRDFAGLTSYGLGCLQSGNLPLAELIARLLLKEDADYSPAHILLGLIAMNVGMFDAAIKHFKQAIRLSPGDSEAMKYLVLAKQQKSRAAASSRGKPHNPRNVPGKYLLIKSWGYGLWSDLDHVLGQLLLAEMTGRIPVVHWGANSLFRDTGCDNAFTEFFEPVSGHTISDITGGGLSYYPPKWTDENLALEDINKWDGPYSRMTGLYFLNRHEAVVVSDFHTYLADLVPWIPAGHALHGLEPQEVYRLLFQKYIKPRREIMAEIDRFWDHSMKGRHVVGVHVRGSDKIIEVPELQDINNSFHKKIDEYLLGHPEAYIFLLTDSDIILNEYRQKYGTKLIVTDCRRSATGQGVHHQDTPSKYQIGFEVIRDAYLAARCDYFIGCGHSNVSTSILHMKNWRSSEYHLIGRNLLFTPNFEMHRR